MGTIDFKKWVDMFELTLGLCEIKGGMTERLQISGPATIAEIKNIENTIGNSLPSEFIDILQCFAKRVYFRWYRESGIELFRENAYLNEQNVNIPSFESKVIVSGGILDNALWDIDKLFDYNLSRETYEFLDELYEKEYWKNSLIFASHGNGDYFALDLKYNVGEVVYLSTNHDMHGWRLGKNIISFYNEWIHIGCAGHWGEEFLLLSGKNQSYIDSESFNSMKVKLWIGYETQF